ncbi:MAG: hypothetical protein K2X77_00710 [Candidatus Obscuribacterales bacterium]|jgi:hypothetical protein|nr:hypothetical protein [Candidatus Obscuribacterales bacterium]
MPDSTSTYEDCLQVDNESSLRQHALQKAGDIAILAESWHETQLTIAELSKFSSAYKRLSINILRSFAIEKYQKTAAHS